MVLRLPWVGAGSARVEKEVRSTVCSSYPCMQFYVVFGTTRAFRVKKDVLPTLRRSNLIYYFQCREYENRYVGRTLQHLALGARIRQHVQLGLVPVDARGTRPRRGRPPNYAVPSDAGTPLNASTVDVRMRASASTGGELDPSQTSVRKRGRPSRKPPNVTLQVTDTGRVTRSKVKRRSTGDLNTSILEATTTINKGKPVDAPDLKNHFGTQNSIFQMHPFCALFSRHSQHNDCLHVNTLPASLTLSRR